MKWVAKVLQLPVVVVCRWSFSRGPELLEKGQLVRGRRSAERTILQERRESRLPIRRRSEFPLDELEPRDTSRADPWVYRYLHGECRQVNVPGFDQGIEQGDAQLRRQVEDIGVEEILHGAADLFETSTGELRQPLEPLFVLRLLLRDSLGHLQESLSHQTLDLPERLGHHDRPHVGGVVRAALAEDQRPELREQGGRRAVQRSLELFLPLQIHQARELPAGELQHLLELLIEIGTVGRRRCLPPGQQLGNVRLGDLRSSGEIALLQSEFHEPLPDKESWIHLHAPVIN